MEEKRVEFKPRWNDKFQPQVTSGHLKGDDWELLFEVYTTYEAKITTPLQEFHDRIIAKRGVHESNSEATSGGAAPLPLV